MSQAEAPAKKSDLSTRFVIGVVLIAVACCAIYFGGWPFRLLVMLGAALMLIEWADMHRVPRLWAYIGVALLAANLLLAGEHWFPAADSGPAAIGLDTLDNAWLGFAAAAVLAIAIGLVSRRPAMLGGFLYVAIPAFALIVLDWAWFELVFWLMIATWATDICAYFAGRAIGGPKLAPRVSPNKTWAGLIGGMLGAALFGALAAWFFNLGQPYYWIGAPMGVLAQCGDLYESWLKRRAGVKDSGTILPGHGGVLDRVDGLLPVIVATFLLLALRAGQG